MLCLEASSEACCSVESSFPAETFPARLCQTADSFPELVLSVLFQEDWTKA